MASSDKDDDIVSSAVLITSTLYQRRQVNARMCKRNSWARGWITAKFSICVRSLLQDACEVAETETKPDMRRCESDGAVSCMLGTGSAVCEWFMTQKATDD